MQQTAQRTQIDLGHAQRQHLNLVAAVVASVGCSEGDPECLSSILQLALLERVTSMLVKSVLVLATL